MTEQTLTQPGTQPGPEAPAPAEAPAEVRAQPPAPAPEKPRKSRRPLLRGIARWTAAVLVLGGVGTGTAMGITAMERTDVPGLATESDGRWDYPRLALPALPDGTLRPFTEGNDGEVHHADLRQLLLPAPAGATVDPKLKGGWVGLDTYLAHFHADDRSAVKEALAESALRHVAARGWTTPDGTSTRVYLMRFTSVAFAEAFKDEVLDAGTRGSRLPAGVDGETLDSSLSDVRLSFLSLYSFDERKPYGPEQTRWAYIQAGDTLGLVVQSRKGEALTVPFQQTVALQAQLLS
ncbi:hypothetical protein OG259_19620 [Streptomyces sp. NBC_00250]|uniref:hypothetical protein n=1 Tax=Streptomyces sp. NBC_00250 TaxID=2903641 RepID=UPI002E2DA632|nr:hypothetical protein [Streptomyces sp. NBC_00250]